MSRLSAELSLAPTARLGIFGKTFRYGSRILMKKPGFTAIVVIKERIGPDHAMLPQ